MGGVDKLDHLIALYRIKTRTKKWTVKLIFHFVDFVLVNAWLEYRRDAELYDPSSKYMDLLEFRSQVAEALIKTTPKQYHINNFYTVYIVLCTEGVK